MTIRRDQPIGPTVIRRSWIPDLALGFAVGVVGLVEVVLTRFRSAPTLVPSATPVTFTAPDWFAIVLVIGVATAVGLCRRAPAVALALCWVLGGIQMITSVPAMVIELSLVAVVFGTARWGRPITAIAGAVSVPAVPILGVALVRIGLFSQIVAMTSSERLVQFLFQSGPSSWRVAVGIAAVAILGVPWLAGLTVRFLRRAAESRHSKDVAEAEASRARRELEQAQEISRLREQQTRLANDVHDVVGHSLAVILAQAESAQYLPDSDVGRIKAAMATVADSARSSLQDVRQVLSTEDGSAHAPADALDELIEAISDSRPGVRSTEIGRPRPLPPELATVAHRVLQEMLTNVLKHGHRDRPVQIERRWNDDGGELQITIMNTAGAAAADGVSGGKGVPSMRARLQSVGGSFELRQEPSDDGLLVISTARMPIRRGASR